MVGSGSGGAAGSDEHPVARASRQAVAVTRTRTSAFGTLSSLRTFPFALTATTRLAAELLIRRPLLKDVAATPILTPDEPVGINVAVFG